jgi:PrtD family type I secretion system ABC transporter
MRNAQQAVANRSAARAGKSLSRPGFSELRAARRRGAGLLIWAFVFSIFVNLLMLTGPLYMLQVYDRVLASRSVETLVALTVLIGGLFGLMAVLEFARGRVMARIGARFQSALDARVFEAALNQETASSQQSSGTAALRNLDGVQRLFVSPVLPATMDVPWTPLFLAAIFIFHPMLGWLALTGAIFLVALTVINQILTAGMVRQAYAAEQKAQDFAHQVQNGGELVRSQGMIPAMAGRYLQWRGNALLSTIRASDWTGSFTSFTKSFRLFLQSAILGFGAYYVLRAEMTSGAMIAGSILLGRALAPVEQLLGQWPVLQRAQAGWKGLGQYLAEVPPPVSRTTLPEPQAHLEVRHLTVLPAGAKAPTLCNISFELKPGEALGVIGRSGSGKSTLARALVGYWLPFAGEIRLGGATLEQYDPARLGRYVGYLPQTVTLFSGTVAENIARMAVSPNADAVVRAARLANAHEMILKLPEGYDTFINGNENQLSGGQRQRIALARALFGDPVLVVLDEPSSALDHEGSKALNAALRELKAQGRAVIIMTHMPTAIAECDTLLVLEGGAMAAHGPRDVVLKTTQRGAVSSPRNTLIPESIEVS